MVRRTRVGLLVAVVLAVAAVWFGVDASNQKDRAVAAAAEAARQTARAQAYVAQIYNDKGRYFDSSSQSRAIVPVPRCAGLVISRSRSMASSIETDSNRS